MLQTRLLSIMRRELQTQNLQLSIDCTQQIEQLVRRGIDRMRTGRVLDHAGHVIQAERNVKLLIKYFCDFARDAGTFPRLSNADFQKALIACPTIWPYCSSA